MQRIGRYEVRGEIARGGMGAVLRAFDPSLEREVALKLMLSAASADEVRRKRFQREVRALAKLEHPGIVAVHGAGEHRGCPYLVMDLVAGESLAERIDRAGALPVREAVEITRAVALALQHAHGAGILHRDVKPSNVLLPTDGPPMLTDFGLAKDLDASLTGLSQTGRFMGTPGYLPPEQAAGKGDAIGAPSDVYALGATLYHVLVGEPPFEGESLIELMSAMMQPPTPPRSGGPRWILRSRASSCAAWRRSRPTAT